MPSAPIWAAASSSSCRRRTESRRTLSAAACLSTAAIIRLPAAMGCVSRRPGEARAPCVRSEIREATRRVSRPESAGTIVVDTPNKFLFLVRGNGKALRYGIGVGRPGLLVGRQADFRQEGMAGNGRRRRKCWRGRPDLPRHMEGRPAESARRPARCIWAPRSIASTARTSHGRSAPTFRRAASDAQ